MIDKLLIYKDALVIGLVAVLVSSVLCAGGAWWLTSNYFEQRVETVEANHKTAIANLQRDAAAELARVTEQKSIIEAILQEKSYDHQIDYTKRLDAIDARLRSLANVQLRDRTGEAGQGGSGAGNNPSEGTGGGDGSNPGGGLLSESTSEALLRGASEADTILERLRICRAWEADVRMEVEKYNRAIADPVKK